MPLGCNRPNRSSSRRRSTMSMKLVKPGADTRSPDSLNSAQSRPSVSRLRLPTLRPALLSRSRTCTPPKRSKEALLRRAGTEGRARRLSSELGESVGFNLASLIVDEKTKLRIPAAVLRLSACGAQAEAEVLPRI